MIGNAARVHLVPLMVWFVHTSETGCSEKRYGAVGSGCGRGCSSERSEPLPEQTQDPKTEKVHIYSAVLRIPFKREEGGGVATSSLAHSYAW